MNRLLNNWTLKITSLVLALALWGHVRGEVNPSETATFTVRLDNAAPRGWALLKPETLSKTARVTLRASRATLRELKGGVPANPLAPEGDAPPLAPSIARAHLEFPVLKAGASTATVKVEASIEDAEIIGVKPADAVVTLARTSE